MYVIPAIDIRDGKCVRLYKGDYAQETIYADDPRTVINIFATQKFPWIHIVDLDGARSGERVNQNIISSLASAYPESIEVGGGIRTSEDVAKVLSFGVGRVIMGTALTSMSEKEMRTLFATWGEKVVVGVDVRDGKVAIHGWRETLNTTLLDFISLLEDCGASRAIVTEISTDGTLAGPAISLYTELVQKTSLSIIASGGIGSLQDIRAVSHAGVEAVIVGKAYYEGLISLETMASFTN